MHDPMTVAHEIKSPFVHKITGGFEHRETWLTVWHVDPERDGDEDSCDWFGGHLTDEDREWARKRAVSEWDGWYSEEWCDLNLRLCGNLEILALAWAEARHRAEGVSRWRRLSAWEMSQIFSLMSCPGDNFGHVVRGASLNADGLSNLLLLVLRAYRKARRPWWRHPRWHVRHWRLQVHWLQDFKRFAFSRCAGCGGPFRWGYSPISTDWNSKGPRWFAGEPRIFHHECRQAFTSPATEEEAEARYR